MTTEEEEAKEGPFLMDFDKLRASMSPAARRNWDRHGQYVVRQMRVGKAFPWMRWPLLVLVYGFWTSLMDEGIRSTCKPRWGSITFAYLNDGMKPTVWHTYQQVMHPFGRYDGIYPGGAPRNKAEADAVEERAMNGDGAGL